MQIYLFAFGYMFKDNFVIEGGMQLFISDSLSFKLPEGFHDSL